MEMQIMSEWGESYVRAKEQIQAAKINIKLAQARTSMWYID